MEVKASPTNLIEYQSLLKTVLVTAGRGFLSIGGDRPAAGTWIWLKGVEMRRFARQVVVEGGEARTRSFFPLLLGLVLVFVVVPRPCDLAFLLLPSPAIMAVRSETLQMVWTGQSDSEGCFLLDQTSWLHLPGRAPS